jgi:diaminohydroxyphosphoribosylaminopyrimidine deaminase/5-amino-6-(5-phosphoribosylamino)uracil reductase
VLPGRNKRIEIDKQSKIEFWYTGEKYGRGHLDSFMETAYEQGLTSILVEGGCRLSSQFIENRLVNKLYLFYSNRILGRGRESMLFDKGFMINNCVYLDKIDIRQFGVDVLVSGYPSFPESI